jgi:hypothetical protein
MAFDQTRHKQTTVQVNELGRWTSPHSDLFIRANGSDTMIHHSNRGGSNNLRIHTGHNATEQNGIGFGIPGVITFA